MAENKEQTESLKFTGAVQKSTAIILKVNLDPQFAGLQQNNHTRAHIIIYIYIHNGQQNKLLYPAHFRTGVITFCIHHVATFFSHSCPGEAHDYC